MGSLSNASAEAARRSSGIRETILRPLYAARSRTGRCTLLCDVMLILFPVPTADLSLENYTQHDSDTVGQLNDTTMENPRNTHRPKR